MFDIVCGCGSDFVSQDSDVNTSVDTDYMCYLSLCELFILETSLMGNNFGNNVPKQMQTCMHYLPQPCHFHFRWIIVILSLPCMFNFKCQMSDIPLRVLGKKFQPKPDAELCVKMSENWSLNVSKLYRC